MREIGGYIELDTYHLPMLHSGALALNCGDAAKIANLAYATPALSVFICGTVLGEGLHLSSFAGLALILLGFFVQKRFERRGKAKAQNPAQ